MAYSRWTPDMEATLRREWAARTQIKAIARLLGVPPRQVEYRRAIMKLPARRPPPGSVPNKKNAVMAYFDDGEMRRLRRRAAERGVPLSHYIRALVLRDTHGVR